MCHGEEIMAKKNDSQFEQYQAVKESLKRKSVLKRILGKSGAIRDVRRKIEQISACDANVLITGESGTGKEPAARCIHYLSARAGNPFVPVNCGAIPENLFENELFGHVKGAFTDAGAPQDGLVKEANGGSIFLDEVGVISPYIQVKLLRLLQDKEYRPLGDSRHHSADIRIIAATNEDLHSMVKKGTFREDLYYRLNIVSLHIPPLKERKEDIPILAHHFVEMYSRRFNRPVNGILPEAVQSLLSYSWPGNIRELENIIQQALILATGERIDTPDLQLPRSTPKPKTGTFEEFNKAKKKIIDTFEKNYLIKLLTRFNGEMVRAAAAAGKSRTALWNLCSKHKLHPKQFTREH
jgi:transcriptional regulator with PAS, ATPase and Fis domain